MELGTDIYGVHFGDGWEVDASFAFGSLSGSDLTVWGAHRCDSHLDLLEAVVYFNGPFGVPTRSSISVAGQDRSRSGGRHS